MAGRFRYTPGGDYDSGNSARLTFSWTQVDGSRAATIGPALDVAGRGRSDAFVLLQGRQSVPAFTDGFKPVLAGKVGVLLSYADASAAATFFGGAFGDRLVGSAFADALDGNAGDDRLRGNDGDDTLLGESGEDRLSGGDGADRLDGGSSADDLRGGTGGDRLMGESGADRLSGGEGDDALDGGSDDDALRGGAGDDGLLGSSGNDSLRGGEGDDVLRGGTGADALSGGAGADAFVYGGLDEGGDRIAGFTTGEDRIALDRALFGAAPPAAGALDPELFAANAGGVATEADDRLVYDTDSGELFFDADGSGSGAAVLLATLTGAPTLAAGDFVVI
ncbi:MAG TPA: calcium-binding protein [Microvirga sp.]|jgi:Ca2+-binding RTX toxin-like protein|nr:calcium-binding protein [Microvirga sp.]